MFDEFLMYGTGVATLVVLLTICMYFVFCYFPKILDGNRSQTLIAKEHRTPSHQIEPNTPAYGDIEEITGDTYNPYPTKAPEPELVELPRAMSLNTPARRNPRKKITVMTVAEATATNKKDDDV